MQHCVLARPRAEKWTFVPNEGALSVWRAPPPAGSLHARRHALARLGGALLRRVSMRARPEARTRALVRNGVRGGPGGAPFDIPGWVSMRTESSAWSTEARLGAQWCVRRPGRELGGAPLGSRAMRTESSAWSTVCTKGLAGSSEARLWYPGLGLNAHGELGRARLGAQWCARRAWPGARRHALDVPG